MTCYSDHNEDIRTKGSCDYCGLSLKSYLVKWRLLGSKGLTTIYSGSGPNEAIEQIKNEFRKDWLLRLVLRFGKFEVIEE